MSQNSYPLVERIARVLAGAALSSNADGDDPHAARAVDSSWHEHRNQALAILHTLRDPDPTIHDDEEARAWRKMIDAAIDAG